MPENLSSAAVVIGILRVNRFIYGILSAPLRDVTMGKDSVSAGRSHKICDQFLQPELLPHRS